MHSRTPTLRAAARAMARAARARPARRVSPTARAHGTTAEGSGGDDATADAHTLSPTHPPPTVPGNQQPASETVTPTASPSAPPPADDADPDADPDDDMVEMWNKEAPAGPEWGGPRDYEPTRFGDWATRGRVSDF